MTICVFGISNLSFSDALLSTQPEVRFDEGSHAPARS